jgi:hypothetical protein
MLPNSLQSLPFPHHFLSLSYLRHCPPSLLNSIYHIYLITQFHHHQLHFNNYNFSLQQPFLHNGATSSY